MSNPWKSARSVADLGNLMADWLEGRIPTRPGYCDTQPDEETNHLIPVLAPACRAGLVTTNSQPGHPPVRGYDGRTWRQRAFVEGWIADGALLARIRAAAKRAGMTVVAHGPSSRGGDWIPLTDADDEIQMAAGDYPGHRRMINTEWRGIGRHATNELCHATHIDLIDPVWGRDDRLWPALANVIR
ncbi:DUF6919 domain-containing protein [Streptomyces sparsogenes]|uniref:DUF6919 domain-containing protein n=1 Tax=Streptomyces sparsogenes DSM 40356 TaxID=1331668 RepID=A0A1R1S7U1_9ACTN|nr:hypothetical protein [Streptomyces sparsogenes]OMI34401.1 hypothetical protein SPAR_36496 [Streptomyces sparsogenes DSM 40356]